MAPLSMPEALALVAIRPDSGRHAAGDRSNLNATLAGLLIAELVLAETVTSGRRPGDVVVTGPRPDDPLLAAAAEVVEAKGPKAKSVLSAMDRGLDQRLGGGTWDSVLAALARSGVVSAPSGGLRPSVELLQPGARNAVVGDLRRAAATDEPLDIRTAAVLSMTGPAQLLEVVAPDRSGRKHARRRIDTALEATHLRPVAEVVRTVIAEAAAAATTAAVVASTSVAASS